VDPHTLFQTASISKSVTAAGALCLVKEGLLGLDDAVGPLLPAGRVPGVKYAGQVTLRRLLSHSAGIGVPGFAGYGAGDRLPTLAEMLAGRQPAHSPAQRPRTTCSPACCCEPSPAARAGWPRRAGPCCGF
jgi:CubicO group peptidase (beta-lactamase class C family)